MTSARTAVDSWRTSTTSAGAGLSIPLLTLTLCVGCELSAQIASFRHEVDAGVDADQRGELDADSRRDVGVDSSLDSHVDSYIDSDEDHDDGEWMCDHSVCDLWPQCGCRPGDRCVPDEENVRECVAAGTTGHGGECDMSGEGCAAGTICVGFADQPSQCLQLYNDDDDCLGRGQGSRCEAELVSASGAKLAMACSVSCDPASLDPVCLEGIRCDIFRRLRAHPGQ